MAREAARLANALVAAMPALALFFAFSSSVSSAAYGSESSTHAGANSNAASNSKSTANQTSTKLVSFAPSNTELLFAIGAGDKLIGVCSYCDYPDAAKKKTVVGNFIAANLERMAALKPDRVVCVSGQEALAGQLAHNNYKVSIFKNDHISDISKNLKDLAQLANSTGRGDQAAAAFDRCVADLKATTTKTALKPSVFYCVWPQPLLTLGKASYLTEAITICGGESISKDLQAGYPHFSLEKLVLANPDIIVMPFECKDHSFLEKHPWSSLKAVKNNRVYFLPDPPHDGLARPTLRLTNGLYWLAKKVHPELSSQLDGWSARTQAALTPFGLSANSTAAKP
jgi:iron complex transport system substrate-binding protein